MEPKIEEYKLKIIKIIDECPEVKTFRVEIPEGNDISYKPGQFFMVRFEDSKVFHRAYSISSSPTQKDFMEITMDLVGEFTTKLFKSKVGDNLIFKGPYGRFYFTEEMKNNLVLIGGGLGITPLRSIIRYCTDKKLQNKINLLYSVKTPEDIVYKDEIDEFNELNFNFDCIVTVTRPKPKDNWNKRTGRIDKELLKQNIKEISNTLFFICGSLEFTKNIISMIEELGIKKEQIKTDIWGE